MSAIGLLGMSLTGMRRWESNFAFTSAFPSGVAYTRTGAATALTSGGVVVPFATGVPPVTDRGLLIEPATTNLWLASSDFGNAAWTLVDATVTPDVAAGPDGTSTADLLSDPSASTFGYDVLPVSIPNNAASYTMSVFVKKTTGGTAPSFGLTFSMYGGAPVSINGRLNTDTGVVAGATLNTTVESVGDWWRIAVTGANNATGNTVGQALIFPTSGFTPNTDNAAAIGGALVWGAQMESGPLSSYVPTNGAAATRGLPIATLTAPSSSWTATYGSSNTVVTGTTAPGVSFDLVTGRPWLGLGNELKSLVFS